MGGPSRRYGTGRGTLPEFRDGLEILGEVRDGSGDAPRGSGLVGGPSRRFRIGRETLQQVRDRSGGPLGGP